MQFNFKKLRIISSEKVSLWLVLIIFYPLQKHIGIFSG